jgi:uncharacterized protein
MSVANKSIVFLALTFAISWAITIGAHFAGLKQSLGPILILFAMMFGPSIGALFCVVAFEKGGRVDALGLRIKPSLWWIAAWLAPLAIAAISVLATVLLGNRQLVDVGITIINAVAAQSPEQAEQLRSVSHLGLIYLAAGATIGAAVNMVILTFTEELGWRGYLYHLWRPFGFWRASIGTGVIWGVWHMPAIVYYDLNYPDDPYLGLVFFIAWCALLSPIMTLIRDRTGSVWAAGLFHGTINAIGGFTMAAVSDPAFPWNGIVGIGGFIALAIGIVIVFLLRRRSSEPAPVAT